MRNTIKALSLALVLVITAASTSFAGYDEELTAISAITDAMDLANELMTEGRDSPEPLLFINEARAVLYNAWNDTFDPVFTTDCGLKVATATREVLQDVLFTFNAFELYLVQTTGTPFDFGQFLEVYQVPDFTARNGGICKD